MDGAGEREDISEESDEVGVGDGGCRTGEDAWIEGGVCTIYGWGDRRKSGRRENDDKRDDMRKKEERRGDEKGDDDARAYGEERCG